MINSLQKQIILILLKTKYQTDKTELEKKIANVTDFAKKKFFTELEKKNSRC